MPVLERGTLMEGSREICRGTRQACILPSGASRQIVVTAEGDVFPVDEDRHTFVHDPKIYCTAVLHYSTGSGIVAMSGKTLTDFKSWHSSWLRTHRVRDPSGYIYMGIIVHERRGGEVENERFIPVAQWDAFVSSVENTINATA